MTAAIKMGACPSQTLMRGLDLLDMVGRDGPVSLKTLTARTALSRSTAHRLAAALVERGYLRLGERGYELGFKLLQLAAAASRQLPLEGVARPHLECLARAHLDAVNLAICEGNQVRYIDQLPGFRRVEIRSVIGETRPLASTALGRALMLDQSVELWRNAYSASLGEDVDEAAEEAWIDRMQVFRRQGATFDVEENADQVRCVAAPIRGAGGAIVAALSLSSLPQYMDDARMAQLVAPVVATARAISAELGWRDD